MEKDFEESFSQLKIEDNDGKIKDEKDTLRQTIWSKLDSKKLIRSYPPSCVGKIPNFKGNQFAAERVTKLREFRNAKVIKINPSLAQMTLRQHVMNASKILIGTLFTEKYFTHANESKYFHGFTLYRHSRLESLALW